MIFHHGQRDGDDDEGSGGKAYDFPFVHSVTNPKFEIIFNYEMRKIRERA
jgi:hypothetical protein